MLDYGRAWHKHVEIAVIDGKYQITALLTCTSAVNYLPIQLVYEETTY